MTSTITQKDWTQSAWKFLDDSIIYYQGKPIGTQAAKDPQLKALNYDQCFVRDFVPVGLLFLMHGKTEIVRNFLEITLKLQSHDPEMDCFQPGPGLMPASFKVESNGNEEFLTADFGQHAMVEDHSFGVSLAFLLSIPVCGGCFYYVLIPKQQGIPLLHIDQTFKRELS
jgi:hypothetical protein